MSRFVTAGLDPAVHAAQQQIRLLCDHDGLMFGLIVRDVIYLKADEASAADFEREGCGRFTYTRGKNSDRPKQHALPYWRPPERLYDDPNELAAWARKAFATAERKKSAARKRTKRKTPKRRA
jgi:DNA transformation protein and related proteins